MESPEGESVGATTAGLDEVVPLPFDARRRDG